ncbi:hypothetical protein [Photobacterium leiognathi]|nr:hypothetical protein [Photobacterium leiognathi]
MKVLNDNAVLENIIGGYSGLKAGSNKYGGKKDISKASKNKRKK